MTLEPLLAELQAKGVTLQAEEGMLRVKPASLLDPETLELLKHHKAALLTLLEPIRDAPQDDCPSHWTHIPLLPPKGARALTGTPDKPERYRVKLCGVWYIIRFEPTISETHIGVTCAQARRRMFADLSEFYRWAWAEIYASSLIYRETN